MNQIIPSISSLLERDLNRLQVEIESYKSEEDLWRLAGSVNNTPGNLCLHIVGNLNHFIGSVLGDSGYVRDREAEFSVKNVKREMLVEMITDTHKTVHRVLSALGENILEQTYPIRVFGSDMTTGYFLIHVCTHLNYHLGQINYHRRMLDER